LSRKNERRNWTRMGVLLGILIGYLCTATPMVVTGIVYNWDLRDILLGIITLSLIFYVIFNEVTKVYAR
jgi:hypothetical protein